MDPAPQTHPLLRSLQSFVDSTAFHRFVLAAILTAGVLAGLETNAELVARHGPLLHTIDRTILWIFAAELILKLVARGSSWWRFFGDPWNLFDFTIVTVCFLPLESQFAAVLRLVRVLRVLRLVTALPRLQILVGALLKSIPSMGYVGVLLLLHFYIYAVMGVFLFGRNDPLHFGSLGKAMLSLFQVVTLEGWADLMRIQMLGSANFGYDGMESLIIESRAAPGTSVLYFVSFILLGTMIILNLLIGVIMNGMSEAQAEAENADRARHTAETGHPSLLDELRTAEQQLAQLQKQLGLIRNRLGHDLPKNDRSSPTPPQPGPDHPPTPS